MPAKRSAMRKIKEVLRLKFEAKLSHEKIAAATGMSKGAVTNSLIESATSRPLPVVSPGTRRAVHAWAAAVSSTPRSHQRRLQEIALHLRH